MKRSNVLEAGFIKARSSDLPIMTEEMISEFLESDCRFTAAENQGIKLSKAANRLYGDSAIGYVQVKKEGPLCTVIVRVTPEHKVRNTGYRVTAAIDEKKRCIVSAACLDCTASEGGCKHVVALLFWLRRKCSEPSVTQIDCYWKKPALQLDGSETIMASEMKTSQQRAKRSAAVKTTSVDNSDFLNEVIRLGIERGTSSEIAKHFFNTSSPYDDLDIHMLLCSFHELDKNNPESFLDFVSSKFSAHTIEQVRQLTINESSSCYRLRYGRITDSMLYKAANSASDEGLVQVHSDF